MRQSQTVSFPRFSRLGGEVILIFVACILASVMPAHLLGQQPLAEKNEEPQLPIIEDKPPAATTPATDTKDQPAPETPSASPTEQESTITGKKDNPSPLISEQQATQRGWKRLTKTDHVWVDAKHKRVIVGGAVCHREGPLEMFACPPHTKEYESVVVVYTKAYVLHAALLAVEAVPGNPVQFAPAYVPARGTIVDIDVMWRDAAGKQQKTRAQNWVRQYSTKKAMPYDWVFAGSSFWVDEETKERHYRAEAGDLICVSNFTSATLDLPIASSDSNDGLMFDAFTENIPAEGTGVLLILRPRLTSSESP